MRIISGTNKGRRIRVAGKGIRPTKGLVREALFDMLGSRIQGAIVLDIFAGTGALGLEALSRGASLCFFIEKRSKSLYENVLRCGYRESSKIIACDFRPALKKLQGLRCNIIFLDPPYKKGYVSKTIQYIMANNVLHEKGILVVEHAPGEAIALSGDLRITKVRQYGDTALSFISHGT
ncbi:MAG TPA: 16S rRNA (guanine(966)-N(2))-methyltransferase RsmD [bacterium]|jgi:16S rRNA (guanine966-N2)-methyltransferase